MEALTSRLPRAPLLGRVLPDRIAEEVSSESGVRNGIEGGGLGGLLTSVSFPSERIQKLERNFRVMGKKREEDDVAIEGKSPGAAYHSSFDKAISFTKDIQEEVARLQADEFYSHHGTPSYVINSDQVHTNIYGHPLMDMGYLASNKREQVGKPPRGKGGERKKGKRSRTKGKYVHADSPHQYMEKTAVNQGTDTLGIYEDNGRPTRTTVLRKRLRFSTAPDLSFSFIANQRDDPREAARQKRRARTAENKIKCTQSQYIKDNLHAYLVGARYNTRWVDYKGTAKTGVTALKRKPDMVYSTHFSEKFIGSNTDKQKSVTIANEGAAMPGEAKATSQKRPVWLESAERELREPSARPYAMSRPCSADLLHVQQALRVNSMTPPPQRARSAALSSRARRLQSASSASESAYSPDSLIKDLDSQIPSEASPDLRGIIRIVKDDHTFDQIHDPLGRGRGHIRLPSIPSSNQTHHDVRGTTPTPADSQEDSQSSKGNPDEPPISVHMMPSSAERAGHVTTLPSLGRSLGSVRECIDEEDEAGELDDELDEEVTSASETVSPGPRHVVTAMTDGSQMCDTPVSIVIAPPPGGVHSTALPDSRVTTAEMERIGYGLDQMSVNSDGEDEKMNEGSEKIEPGHRSEDIINTELKEGDHNGKDGARDNEQNSSKVAGDLVADGSFFVTQGETAQEANANREEGGQEETNPREADSPPHSITPL